MIKDNTPKRPNKYPRGHIKERERILKELRRVYIEVNNTKTLRNLDKAYKKIVKLQEQDMIPWIDIPYDKK
jgi:hypothetical protein|tara:strand:+ start:6366 stop:6578 length:213 start_codon:yes stop_codon:yes gene_type:complete